MANGSEETSFSEPHPKEKENSKQLQMKRKQEG